MIARIKSFKAGGHLVKIKRSTPDPEQANVLGCMDYGSRGGLEVRVSPKLDGPTAAAVDCHEVVETWCAVYGVNITHDKITALGEALHQFLQTVKYCDDT